MPNSATWTTLVIYTELIEKIAVLISGKLPSDDYDFEFDATGLADGTYIAKLNVGSIVFLEEMTKKSIVNSNNDVLLKE